MKNEGLGTFSVLQIIFIVLKLLKLISWSWWWVLSPTWMSVTLIVIIIMWVGIWQ